MLKQKIQDIILVVFIFLVRIDILRFWEPKKYETWRTVYTIRIRTLNNDVKKYKKVVVKNQKISEHLILRFFYLPFYNLEYENIQACRIELEERMSRLILREDKIKLNGEVNEQILNEIQLIYSNASRVYERYMFLEQAMKNC